MDSSVVIDGGGRGEGSGETVYTFSAFATTAVLARKVVFGVGHESADFRTEWSWFRGERGFDEGIDKLDGEFRKHL
jgi:hypothetical protein